MRAGVISSVVMFASTFALADLVPVSQTRELSASASLYDGPAQTQYGDTDGDLTMELGSWNRVVDATAGTKFFNVGARASQMSALETTGASGRGDVSLVTPRLQSMSLGSANALSSLRYEFDLVEPTPVSFNAAVSDATDFGITSFVSLTGPGTSIEIGVQAPLATSFSGTLQPGRYSIIAEVVRDLEVQTGLPGDQGVGVASSWEFDLTVIPAPSGAAVVLLGSCAFFRHRR